MIFCVLYLLQLIVTADFFPLHNLFFRMSSFEVKDILSPDDLKREFDLIGLTELYKQFVSSLIWQEAAV